MKAKVTKLAVLFLSAVGVARAESFTYTASFDFMALSFNVHRLLGASEQQIKLKDVTLFERPTIFAPEVANGDGTYSYLPEVPRLISVSASNLDFNAVFLYQVRCGALGEQCSPSATGNYRWQESISYFMVFSSAVNGVGQFIPVHSEADAATNGNAPLGESHNLLELNDATLTVVDPPGRWQHRNPTAASCLAHAL